MQLIRSSLKFFSLCNARVLRRMRPSSSRLACDTLWIDCKSCSAAPPNSARWLIRLKFATLVMSRRPERAQKIPSDADGHNQYLNDRGFEALKIAEESFRAIKELRRSTIKTDSTRTGVAWGGCPLIDSERPGYSAPPEDFAIWRIF